MHCLVAVVNHKKTVIAKQLAANAMKAMVNVPASGALGVLRSILGFPGVQASVLLDCSPLAEAFCLATRYRESVDALVDALIANL